MLTAILSWRKGLARSLANRICETLGNIGEENWRGGRDGKEEEEKEEEEEEEEKEQTALIRSSNPRLADKKNLRMFMESAS